MTHPAVDESQTLRVALDAIATMLALAPADMLGLAAEISKNPELAAEVAHKLTVDGGWPVSVAQITRILREIGDVGASVLDLITVEDMMRKGEALYSAPVQPWPAVEELRRALGGSLRALRGYVLQLPSPTVESRVLH